MDLYEKTASGAFKRKPTDHYLDVGDECVDQILDYFFSVVQPDGTTFFDAKMFPENDYVTLISDKMIDEELLGKMLALDEVPECSENRMAYKIRQL